MAANPFDSGMITTLQEVDGMIYYIVPAGLPLFKATKTYDPRTQGLHLNPNAHYFFGVRNMDRGYIASYEEEYGIIFEFITTRQYKLLALDKQETQTQLYNSAPEDIKTILRKNYGYVSGIRNSVNEADQKLSKYLCTKGYDGYAIHHMETDFGGSFHPEFMICNIQNGIQYVRQVTGESQMHAILDKEREKQVEQQREAARRSARDELRKQSRPAFAAAAPSLFSSRLDFGDDEDDDDDKPSSSLIRSSIFSGGARKRKTMMKKRKIRRQSRRKQTKKQRSKRRRTRNYGTGKGR
jgi:hypothetical protein